MEIAPLPEDEAARLAELARYQILDTEPEEGFDDLAVLAAQICGTPIALVSLVDRTRQWFKARVGFELREASRDSAFCAHAIRQPHLFVVSDATKDPRFVDNPLVTADPHVRLYAGMPLVTAGGHRLGTLCVIDRMPRQLTVLQQEALRRLAKQTVRLLERRLQDLAPLDKRATLLDQETGLKASEARYRALFESSQDAIMTLAPPAWRFTSGNPATVRMFRTRDEAEFISLGPWELSPERQPDGRPSGEKAKEMIDLAMQKGGHLFEWRHKRLTGEEFPATVLLTRLQVGDQLQLQATVRDVTEEKRAEEALRASEAQYKQLVESANDIIYRADARGHFTFISPSVASFMGFAPEELLGQRFTVLIRRDVRRRVERFYDRQFLRAIPVTYHEFPVLRKDGGELWVGQQVHMLREGGQVAGFHAIVRDITDRKRAEALLHQAHEELEQRVHARTLELTTINETLRAEIAQREQLEQQLRQSQKMEALGTLAGGVAHDFNNLLTIMKGYSNLMLAKPDLRADVRKNLEQIEKAADRASGLTQQLLAFSRNQPVESKLTDANGLVSTVAPLLRRLIGEHITLTVTLSASPCYAILDRVGFEQVLINLAANARDAMPDGGRLTIRTSIGGPLGEAGETVVLTVSDTGIGMDAATQARIFEPFYTTKPVGKGTGLGLATVYRIVEQSGGMITVTSAPGAGTAFTLAFPRSAAPDPLAEAVPDTGDRRGSETILAVEDEPSVRALTKEVLERDGYRVLEAADGKEGLAVARTFPGRIHLLLTDAMMPELNGWDLVQEISLLRPDIRVLFLTGYVDTVIPHYEELEQRGCMLYKPVGNEALARAVREMLDRADAPTAGSLRTDRAVRRLVILDDESQIRIMVEDVLKGEPFEVRTCATAQEAYRCLESAPADILLVDMLMPEVDGIEAIRKVRRTWPGLRVIAMTGGGAVNAEVYLTMARAFGVVGTLSKPFTKQELLQVLAACEAQEPPVQPS